MPGSRCSTAVGTMLRTNSPKASPRWCEHTAPRTTEAAAPPIERRGPANGAHRSLLDPKGSLKFGNLAAMLPSGKARAGPRGLARVARRSLTRWSLRWLGVLVLFAALLGPTAALAGNPDLRWRTIETEHFYVHYYAGEEEIAERVAMVAERAYARLTQAWGHRVYSKTHIVLTDDTDTANGFANTVPYPNVRAFATAPEALSVLEAYDGWVDILITHELVHIVHLDTVHGIARAINAVLGFGRL